MLLTAAASLATLYVIVALIAFALAVYAAWRGAFAVAAALVVIGVVVLAGT